MTTERIAEIQEAQAKIDECQEKMCLGAIITPEEMCHYESFVQTVHSAIPELLTALSALTDENARLAKERDGFRQDLSAISTGLYREFDESKGDKCSGDLLDDFACFMEHHKSKEAQLTAAHLEKGRLREALQRLWDEDEMGWLVDGNTSECVKCGAKNTNALPMLHKDGCVQGFIYKALTLTTPNPIEQAADKEMNSLKKNFPPCDCESLSGKMHRTDCKWAHEQSKKVADALERLKELERDKEEKQT